MRFDELLYNYDLLDALEDMRFYECTPIQEKAIPVVEEGRDLLALAQTGTGKTAAYLLPIIDLLVDGGYPERAVNCIVMAPTRELAQQIDQQMQGFGYFLPQISSAAIYGGNDGGNFEKQKRALTHGADIIVATPGRLIAHMQMGYVDLSQVSFFVLDEADRMLDMGFVDDILKIMSYLPKNHQTLMFSATISPKIKKFAQTLLNDPVEIKIALSKPPETIDQQAYVVYEPQKEALLKYVLKNIEVDRIIIFSSSKQNVKQLTRKIRSWHYNVAEIHSDLEQPERERTMLDFRSGKVNVLVATDIVARGIDVDDISTIINYDVPHEAEDYVHRIGRTARASSTGRAITFIGDREREKFRRIEQLIEKEVPKGAVPPDLGDTPSYSGAAKREGRHRGRKDRMRHSPKKPAKDKSASAHQSKPKKHTATEKPAPAPQTKPKKRPATEKPAPAPQTKAKKHPAKGDKPKER